MKFLLFLAAFASVGLAAPQGEADPAATKDEVDPAAMFNAIDVDGSREELISRIKDGGLPEPSLAGLIVCLFEIFVRILKR